MVLERLQDTSLPHSFQLQLIEMLREQVSHCLGRLELQGKYPFS
jgi:hypothetical protein